MTTTDARLFTIWVTALFPNVEHAVTDEEMAARNKEHRGEFHPLCGAVFLPAPSTRPPGWECPDCARFLQARATLSDFSVRLNAPRGHRGRHGRLGRWGRLFGCRRGR